MSKHSITVKNKRYSYEIEGHDEEHYHVVCPSAGIDQLFHKDDLAEFLVDLPTWIIDHQERTSKEATIRFRVSAEQKKEIEKRAVESGYKSISAYLRDMALKVVP